ncbi:HlyD family secretion protein [Luteimonas sp. SDU101]|uniref:HlyD family secretion protein n=1 Tax=unclassified Luteimonas TaxID=2629088 RepID=UPI003EBCA662
MDMSRGLFRAQALQAKRTGWLGDISVNQPPGHWAILVVAVAAATVTVVFLCAGSYTSRARVVGQLVPVNGLSDVVAPATGVLGLVEVPEGGTVEAGQTLATLVVPRATLGKGDAQLALERQLQRRRQELASGRTGREHQLRAEIEGLRAQLVVSQSELAQIESEIDTSFEQVVIAEEILERMARLLDSRHVSEIEVQRQKALVLAKRSDLQNLERQAISSRRAIAQLQQSLEEIPGRRIATEASFQEELARLEQEQVETEARGALKLVAPVSGVVAIQSAKEGQAVETGQSIFTLLPGAGELEAELMIPSRSIGFIAPGAKVLLRYQAYPYQKFGHHEGRAVRISRSAVNAPSDKGGLPGSDQFYRISVALQRQHVIAYGKQEPLKPGMLVEADILGEHRRLVEWMFEPLFSLRSKMQGS